MRVLLINSVCGRQSTGRIVTDIKRELVKKGHECVIAYGEADSLADADDYHIGSELDRYIHAGLSRIFDDAGFHSLRATQKLVDWIDNFKPDIIHLHNIHGYYINIEVLFNYLKESRVKVIWTFHDGWAFSGHSAYCDAVKCERWKTECFHCPQIREYPKAFIDRSQYNYYKKKIIFNSLENMTIVTPSEWLANNVRRSFLKNYPVIVINNGIELNTFKPIPSKFREKYKISEEKTVVLGVANVWNDLKGLSDFYKLSEKITDNFQMVIVGLQKDQVQLAPKKVIAITRTENVNELAQIYAASDVFINLTYCDTYPTVNIEALACGTPVITYKTGGSPEMIQEGCGYVVAQGDLMKIVEILKNFNKKVDRNKIRKSVEKLAKQDAVLNYINLYEQTLKQ